VTTKGTAELWLWALLWTLLRGLPPRLHRLTTEKTNNADSEGEAADKDIPAVLQESDPSGSEYQSEEEEDEDDVDLEEDEPDTSIKAKKGGKKQKKGLAAREQISAEVAVIIADLDEQPRPNVEGVKRKSHLEAPR
jgi:hypothetical protein